MNTDRLHINIDKLKSLKNNQIISIRETEGVIKMWYYRVIVEVGGSNLTYNGQKEINYFK